MITVIRVSEYQVVEIRASEHQGIRIRYSGPLFPDLLITWYPAS